MTSTIRCIQWQDDLQWYDSARVSSGGNDDGGDSAVAQATRGAGHGLATDDVALTLLPLESVPKTKAISNVWAQLGVCV